MEILDIFKSKLIKSDCEFPPMILVHGKPGLGKSSLGSQFPNPIFVLTENAFPYGSKITGLPARSIPEFHESLTLIEQVLEQAKTEKKPCFETIVVDHLSGLEGLIQGEIETLHNVKNISELPYGRGYEALSRYWSSENKVEVKGVSNHFIGIIPRLKHIQKKFNVCVLLIAHSKAKTIANPGEEPREMYIPSLTKQTDTLLTCSVDEIIYISPSFSPSSTGLLRSTGFVLNSGNGQPFYESKTRCNLPLTLPYKPNKGFEELAKYLPKWYK